MRPSFNKFAYLGAFVEDFEYQARDIHAEKRGLGLGGEGWMMTGIDPEGCDLRNGGTVARLGFDVPVGTAEEARVALVKLVGDARKIA